MIYKIGSKGSEVKQIQQALSAFGLSVICDGVYGKITAEAVKTFQREHGLTPVDGIVGPSTWHWLIEGAKATGTVIKKSKRRITDIIVHCTATPEGQAKTVAQIRADHKKRGYQDIGYHYLILLDGTIAIGRDVDLIGAHCKNFNAHSIGISYVGGLENKSGVAYKDLPAKDTRTPKQKEALLSLLRMLKKLYPAAVIKGHRDYSPDKDGDGLVEPWEWLKSCPSFPAIDEYKDL